MSTFPVAALGEFLASAEVKALASAAPCAPRLRPLHASWAVTVTAKQLRSGRTTTVCAARTLNATAITTEFMASVPSRS